MSTWPGRTYRYLQVDPLFEFGYGLSYTTFEYQWIQQTHPKKGDETMERILYVEVTNTGSMAGDHMIPLFISLETTNPDLPRKELKSFHKVSLAVGESRKLTFTLQPWKDLLHYIDGTQQVVKGTYRVTIGELSDEFYVL